MGDKGIEPSRISASGSEPLLASVTAIALFKKDHTQVINAVFVLIDFRSIVFTISPYFHFWRKHSDLN